MKEKLKKIIKLLPLIISSYGMALTIYMRIVFMNVDFEQLLFSALKIKGMSLSGIYQGTFFTVLGGSLLLGAYLFIYKLVKKSKKNIILKFEKGNKKRQIKLFPFKFKYYSICILIVSLIYFLVDFGVIKYIVDNLTKTSFYEKYYVDASKISLSFPENKQNLIYIFLESMETTNASIKNGGALNESIIPNLEYIALNNDHFSNTDKLGGMLRTYGTSYTVASLVSQTSGISYRFSIDEDEEYPTFKGLTTIGDILLKEGYKNYFMLGSDSQYAGRKDYFLNHGNYEIFDYNEAKKQGLIDEDYYVWWGYEDLKLYSFAKEKLLEISKRNEPFNFTMLTVDTHFIGGYMDEKCELKYEDDYSNAISCSDKKVYEFIEWIKKQEFYENTTIVIVGDHLTMQSNFYKDIDKNYDRVIYNAIINSRVNSVHSKNRNFGAMDMFPTTLAALGVKIEGERLGLGTNLYSNKKTLIEELGYDYFNDELAKKSKFYKEKILGNY